jgi:hypothetical protein
VLKCTWPWKLANYQYHQAQPIAVAANHDYIK